MWPTRSCFAIRRSSGSPAPDTAHAAVAQKSSSPSSCALGVTDYLCRFLDEPSFFFERGVVTTRSLDEGGCGAALAQQPRSCSPS